MLKFVLLFVFFCTSLPLFGGESIVLTPENTLELRGYIEPESVAKLSQKALELDSLYPEYGPIYLVLHTGGGSIEDGIDLLHVLKGLKRPVHTVVISAYSMGFAVVQNLGTRYVAQFGSLMQHRARGGFKGEFPGQVNSRLNYWIERVRQLDVSTSKRSGRSVEELERLWDNEYWCTGSDCVKAKFADKVADVKCHERLSGTTQVKTEVPVGVGESGVISVQVIEEYSKCPLITAPLSTTTTISGAPGATSSYDIKKAYDEFMASLEDKKAPIPKAWFQGPTYRFP